MSRNRKDMVFDGEKNPVSVETYNVMKFIKKFTMEEGRPPSLMEIGKALKISKTKANSARNKLVDAGFLVRSGTTVVLNTKEWAYIPKVPFVGNVSAGIPKIPESMAECFIPYEAAIHNDYVALRIDGDSMSEAGILNGDIIFVLRNSEAKENDIVIAQVNDETVCKQLTVDDKGQKWLTSCNSKFKPIKFLDGYLIVGIVKDLRRDLANVLSSDLSGQDLK